MKATDHPGFIALLEGIIESVPMDSKSLYSWSDLVSNIRDKCFILASWLDDREFYSLSAIFIEINKSEVFHSQLRTDAFEVLYTLFFSGLRLQYKIKDFSVLASLPKYQKSVQ